MKRPFVSHDVVYARHSHARMPSVITIRRTRQSCRLSVFEAVRYAELLSVIRNVIASGHVATICTPYNPYIISDNGLDSNESGSTLFM